MVDRRRDVLRFRVELLEIRPAIWRELLVPASYSFWDLHVAIQDGMGWLDYHLHEFEVGGGVPGSRASIGIPDDEFEQEFPVLPGWEVAVVDYLEAPRSAMRYSYDFGDDWQHAVVFLGSERREKGVRYPRCVGGERACPPEDCGGVPGYEQLVAALLDPSDPEHEMLTQWIPPGWTPEGFDAARVRFDNPKRRWKLAFEDEA